ncbi:ABC transporter ATP-binding protein [Ilumatobacter sp.]|uniref:ABC transporter ATP-binding protein n=1 Tax=Ilumatobacter sp. TaxID=1967498 RepID=UPI003B51BC86
MSVIEVRDLVKSYGDRRAVDGVSFQVEPGEVYALLGENGAGKSTTVEILEGHRERSAGEVTVLGVDPIDAGRDFRDRIGVVLQSAGIESEFSVREVVELYRSAYRDPRDLDEVLGLVGLEDQVDDRVGSLSGGQKRRVDLALGIVGRPEVLFLDEPTTGFDPTARRRSWDLVEALCAGGTTVLLTTHYLDEAEHLADRVGVLMGGRLVAEGPPAQLIEGISGTTVSFSLPDSVELSDAVDSLRAALATELRVSGRLVQANVDHPTQVVHRATGWAIERRIELEGLTVVRASLEDAFLRLTDTGTDADTDPVSETGTDIDSVAETDAAAGRGPVA